MMKLYSFGVLSHIDDHMYNRNPTLENMISTRRASAGAGPIYHLVEFAHRLNVPDEVFKNAYIQELEKLGMEMVVMYVFCKSHVIAEMLILILSLVQMISFHIAKKR